MSDPNPPSPSPLPSPLPGFIETTPMSLAQGREVIKRYVDTLPGLPGVYRMLDSQGNALYVGKARHLKNRVSNYLNIEAQVGRIQRMIAQTVSMEIVTTRSEAEALLLESNLIKKLSPRYNILLKDDKSFPYILLTGDHDFSRLVKHRGPKTVKGKYFGPFVSALAVNETITLLQKAFLLRPCSDSVFKNRSRPCLQYQIKRCSAPCVGKITKEDYAVLVNQAADFLSGKDTSLKEKLVEEMQKLSLKMHFEKAGIIRDRIRALAHVQQKGFTSSGVGDADIIVLVRSGAQCCIQLFSFRGGRNYGNKSSLPSRTEHLSDSEILTSFMGHHYQRQPAPPLILTSHVLEDPALMEEALHLHGGYKVDIVCPMRGEKRDLVEEALRNAREALIRHNSMYTAQTAVLEGVRDLFGLDEIPQRIEIYDNSHIMGAHPVGAMVVAGPEGFIKQEYRKFNIKQPIAPGDDYGMLREVLMRRFIRLQDGEEEEEAKTPDLVLIDGGVGQLSVAVSVFEELNLPGILFAGISKGPDRNAGREWFHMPGRDAFQLPADDPVLHYLQRLRDEAHRFAIGAHRNKRSKALQYSGLDAIPSIGPNRKKALLLHFGSARAVAAASMEELQKVEGINSAVAQIIYGFYHDG